ncbi:hypothetical protein D9611_013208 [Ephemerocybe angulata]|uniref:Nitroreductase domain-containing protein n=1 Tax=Ephemerocybe angulata TaxID=980116 RepID=A0A8H5BTE1_9AGAR|nr:hypothetical protein D9611_013208 [Tulosesus angulatus]
MSSETETTTTHSEIELQPRYKLVVEPATADVDLVHPLADSPSGTSIAVNVVHVPGSPEMPGVKGEDVNGARDLVDANAVELVDGLIKGRFSCRYFEEEREVERGVVEEILDVARFAPSGNNIQPWEKVYCLTGQTLARVKEDVLAAYQEQFKDGPGELEEGLVNERKHTAQYAYYPRLLPGVYGDRKREFGRVLGETLGIERGDVKGRREAGGRNYQFYGAPVAMVFTINKELTQGSWLDVGFFLQSINIAARARGLETVTQESVTQYQAILRRHLPITENEVVAVTMGLGYPDVEMAARYEMERSRREVSDIAYGGFDSFQVFQGTIASLPGLEDLLVEDIWWPEDGGRNGGSVQAMVPVPRKIINLTIESMDLHVPTYGRTTSQILSWLAHGNVDSFRFMTVREVEGSGVLSKFTRVETLVLGHRWILYPPGLISVKTLSAFKALKNLEIGPAIDLNSRPGDIDPSWPLDLLSSVASPLSYLTFKLLFTGEDELERMDWMTLNCLLQNSPFYAELRGFVIGFMRPDTPRPPPTRDDCDLETLSGFKALKTRNLACNLAPPLGASCRPESDLRLVLPTPVEPFLSDILAGMHC